MREEKSKKVLVPIWPLLVTILTGIIFLSASYAWLSETLGSTKYSLVTSSNPTNPNIELWTNAIGGESDWRKTGDMSSTDPDENKAIPSIGTFSVNGTTGKKTFVLKDKFSLYFGTINSLVQEQDNLPVYLKIKVPIEAKSKNNLYIDYNKPDDDNYATAYKINLATGVSEELEVLDADGNSTSPTGVPWLDTYDLVGVHYVVSSSSSDNYELITDSSGFKLPSAVSDMFDEKQTHTNPINKITSEESSKLSPDIINDTDDTIYAYAYIKFSVSPATLIQVLNDTNVKDNMPIYLMFNLDFSVELRTVALN